jgi:hypothetical protein
MGTNKSKVARQGKFFIFLVQEITDRSIYLESTTDDKEGQP